MERRRSDRRRKASWESKENIMSNTPFSVSNVTMTGNPVAVTIPDAAIGMIVQNRNDAADIKISELVAGTVYFTVKKQTTGTDTPGALRIMFGQRRGGEIIYVNGTNAHVVEIIWVLN